MNITQDTYFFVYL